MRLCASNIAWPREQDAAVAARLQQLGYQAVEIAPTAVWPDPLQATASELARHRDFWAERGLPIRALQALLYGKPELTLFEDAARRQACADHLRGMIRLGARLGARALVFGSPKNRRRGGVDPRTAEQIAVDFFGALGEEARAHGTALCIEPNPGAYGCDFVRTSSQGRALVEATGSEGFCLHLDAGGMTLEGEAPASLPLETLALARHFHISEPELAPIGSGGVAHPEWAARLREARYDRLVSVEMRAPPGPDAWETLSGALAHAARSYAAAGSEG